jgi:hypothetical protein
MSVATLIEATAAVWHNEPVETALLCYHTDNRKYSPAIEKLIGNDVPWLEARKLLDVPRAESDHLPPIRVDTKSRYLFAIRRTHGWEISSHARHRGAR